MKIDPRTVLTRCAVDAGEEFARRCTTWRQGLSGVKPAAGEDTSIFPARTATCKH